MRLRKRLLSWLLCLSLIVGLFALPAAAMGEAHIDIPDARLLALLNRTLGKGRADDDPVTRAELESLTELNNDSLLEFLPMDEVGIQDRGIRSLEGLQYAVNLTSLDLSENRIEDLTPLAGLTNLTSLELDRNMIYDLRPLVGLTGLDNLNIYNNEIYDIRPLASLTNLTSLDLHFANRGKYTVCIEPLAALENLEYISIESNDISDISALEGLQNLTYIKLNANHITDLSPIASYLEAIAHGETECIVEANNQSLPDWEPAIVQSGVDGGEVFLNLPELVGLDPFLMPFDEKISLALRDAEKSAVTVEFPFDWENFQLDVSNVLFTFGDRTYGGIMDIQDILAVNCGLYDEDEGRYQFSYMLALPIRLQQDSLFQTTLSAEAQKGEFVTLDTTQETLKTCLLTGTLSTGNGTPIPLQRIDGITLHNANKDYELAGLSVVDISVSGNQFTFRVEQTGEIEGTWYVTPEVRYVREGSQAVEIIPQKVMTFHLSIGDPAALQVDNVIRFDLAAEDKAGQVTSLPVSVVLPGIEVDWVQLQDRDNNTFFTSRENIDGQFVFKMAGGSLQKIDHLCFYYGTVALFPKISVQPASSDPALAGRFSVAGLTRGDSEAPVVRFDGAVFAQGADLEMTSSDTSILDVRDGRLVGVRAGTADLTLEHLRFPMADWGSVEYLNPVTVSVTVSPRSSSGGGSTTKPETKPEVKPEEEKPAPAAPDTGAVTERYSDLPEGYWANDGIAVVVERGLFVGTGDGSSFSPEQTMDRGMLVTVLGRLAGVSGSAAGAFSDVAPGAYYAPFAAWAKEQGIVSGVGGNRFGAEQPITREQLCVMLVRFAQAQGLVLEAAGGAQAFTDSGDVAGWARDAVELAHSAGLVTGKEGGRFDPQGTATRAEVAVILARFLALFPEV